VIRVNSFDCPAFAPGRVLTVFFAGCVVVMACLL
jgi:hypothetical protein